VTAKLLRTAGLLSLLLTVSGPYASGATPKEIERSLKGGADALKARYGRAGAPVVGGENHGIAGTALVGLALLEAGVPANDPAVKNITEQVRNESYKQTNTYPIALCLMYLDRFGDPADVPRIQMLAVRLLVGQTNNGGWSYTCIAVVSPDDEKRLRAVKADQAAGKLHPEIEKYGQTLMAARNQGAVPGVTAGGDDNSNTQFGLLAVWMSRKHGVPVENALDLIEKRFTASQDGRTGNWPYSGQIAGGMNTPGSPSMYCAGLLGMATAVARREDRRLKTDPPHATKPDTKPTKPSDPFYNPPAGKEPAKPAARPADARDRVVQLAFAGLGLTLTDQIRGKGFLNPMGGGHGYGDLYFFWSMERVGVIYGVDKIGGFDWYDVATTVIVRSQSPDGTWAVGGYGAEVNTAFAVLVLSKSNLARDLSGKVQKDPTSTEMRAGTGPSAADLLPNRPTTPAPITPVPVLNLPNPTGDEAITRASNMLKASGGDWAKLLKEARDGKGANFTRSLVLTATNTDGERKKQARDALAERLCRMSAATLRTMLKGDEVELRRAAALACAMKDDKDHIPDLINALTDADDDVVRAAKAGLKSLTGKDFGPASMSAGQKALTVSAWKEWYAKEKK
jgi:hypothetical protein